MQRNHLKFTGLFILFFLNSLLMAQSIPNLQVSIIVVANTEQMQSLYLSDLDLMQQGTAEHLFDISITNSGSSDIAIEKMTILFRKDDLLLGLAETDPFLIPPGNAYVDNITLFNNDFVFPANGSPVTILDSRIADEAKDLKDKILSSGKAPIGIYTIEATLQTTAGQQDNTGRTIFIAVTNPSFVQLVTPGNSTDYGQPEDVYTEFPIFQWNGNGVGDTYEVVVFEKPSSDISIDQVLNMRPNWRSELQAGQTAQYPAGDAIPLEFGRTYFWMVNMVVETSSGTEALRSDLYQFRLVNPEDLSNGLQLLYKQQFEDLLRQLMGSNAEPLIRELAHYNFEAARLNGQAGTMDELLQHILGYRGKVIEVTDVFIETQN